MPLWKCLSRAKNNQSSEYNLNKIQTFITSFKNGVWRLGRGSSEYVTMLIFSGVLVIWKIVWNSWSNINNFPLFFWAASTDVAQAQNVWQRCSPWWVPSNGADMSKKTKVVVYFLVCPFPLSHHKCAQTCHQDSGLIGPCVHGSDHWPIPKTGLLSSDRVNEQSKMTVARWNTRSWESWRNYIPTLIPVLTNCAQ